jgi:hypothetical protein
MKKLVLILVCTVIMTVFIAFNYLLLDREKTTKNIENLKYNNENQSASIEVLGNDIKNSNNKIDELNKTIRTLDDNNSTLVKTNSELKLNINEINKVINEKNELIDKIKDQIDIKPFEAIIKNWSEGINGGKYETSYNLYKKNEYGEDISFADYSTDLKDSIKSIKLKDIKLQSNTKEDATGNIVFKVSMDIKLLKAATSFSFSDGLNERYFFFGYNKASDTWFISSISTND